MNKAVAAVKEIKIPISGVFEKRLAELIWENCPELAKQTVAGKIAMSLEIDNEATYSLIHHQLKRSTEAFVKEHDEALKKQVQKCLTEFLQNEAADIVSRSVKSAIENTPLANEIGKLVRSTVTYEVNGVVRSLTTGENSDFMKVIVESRIDEYLRCNFGPAKIVTSNSLQ